MKEHAKVKFLSKCCKHDFSLKLACGYISRNSVGEDIGEPMFIPVWVKRWQSGHNTFHALLEKISNLQPWVIQQHLLTSVLGDDSSLGRVQEGKGHNATSPQTATGDSRGKTCLHLVNCHPVVSSSTSALSKSLHCETC